MPPQYDGTPPVRHRARKRRSRPAPTPDYHSSQHAAQTRAYHPPVHDYHSSQHHAQTSHYHPPAKPHYTKPLASSVRKAMHAAKRAAKHGHQAHRGHGRHGTGKGFTRGLDAGIHTGLLDTAGTGAFPAYNQFYDRLYGRAAPSYPNIRYDPLRLAYGKSATAARASMGDAWVNNLGTRGEPVYADAALASDFLSRNRSDREFAQTTPLHEWAHTIQRPRLSRAASEGGAELFASGVASGLGMPYDTSAGGYGSFVRRMLKRGWPWYYGGQFFKDPYGGAH
jgi:hypothetical protein